MDTNLPPPLFDHLLTPGSQPPFMTKGSGSGQSVTRSAEMLLYTLLTSSFDDPRCEGFSPILKLYFDPPTVKMSCFPTSEKLIFPPHHLYCLYFCLCYVYFTQKLFIFNLSVIFFPGTVVYFLTACLLWQLWYSLIC
jgi:hypothetical protein